MWEATADGVYFISLSQPDIVNRYSTAPRIPYTITISTRLDESTVADDPTPNLGDGSADTVVDLQGEQGEQGEQGGGMCSEPSGHVGKLDLGLPAIMLLLAGLVMMGRWPRRRY